ncbi:MAG: ABC transporter substrate-binding protein [Methanotrichaceae archaeon]
MKIGYLTTLYHTSFILRASDRMADMGIKASWKLFPNGPAMVEAFEKNEIDVGYIGLPPAMIGISRGLKIKCIAGGHVEGTVLIGSSGYRSGKNARDVLSQFRGRIIGTPRRGSIHDVILRKLISDFGFNDEIEIKNYDWADFILDAMIDREVDGACGTPPLAVLARRQIEGKIILPPSKIWPYNPSYGIVATERCIKDSSVIEDFLRLHENACNLIRESPKEAAELVHSIMKIIEEDFALEVFNVSPKYCASLPREYIDSAMAFMPELLKMRYISKKLTEEDVFETKFMEKVHPEKAHYDNPGKLMDDNGNSRAS